MRAPILCLVTDRRLGLPTGAGEPDAAARLLQLVTMAARAGTDLIHVRERDLDARPLADLVRACVRAVQGTPTRVVVNDRLDVALAAGAHGVHLRGDSLPTAEVRRLCPRGFLVGRSVRNAASAARASAEVDYLVLGTIFPTPSKPGGDTVIGTAELARAVLAAPVPVIGIGGITEHRLPEVAATGAAGVAAIRLFVDAGSSPDDFGERVARWRTWFDRKGSIS